MALDTKEITTRKTNNMKKILSLILIPALFAGIFYSCTDISQIEQRVNEIESRVTALETQVNTLNSNIETLQALAEGGIISKVEEKDGVYTITLGSGSTITLTQGSIGVANAPVVSIDKDGYWMVDYGKGAEYILVGVQKVKAVGSDGVTPVFGVDANGFWTVSYDGGKTFVQVKDADGNPARAIPDGGVQDKWFNDVKVENGRLVVVTKDDKTYSLPIVADFLCSISNTEDIVLFNAGESKNFTVTMNGVASAIVTAPHGWTATLSETTLSVTAPAVSTKAVSADSKTDVCILAISATGFSSISKVKVQLSDAPVVVNPAATVSFESADVNTLTFRVSAVDVTYWKYICLAASETAPDAARIASEGTAGTSGTVTVESLAADTEYTLYVLPVNGETLGTVVSATGRTQPEPEPEFPGLYGKYMKGEDIVIGGITINKTSFPEVNFITAESENKEIQAGVNFVASDANALFPDSELPMPLYVIGNTEGTRSPIKTNGQIKLASASDTENSFAIENMDMTVENLGTNYLIANWYDFAIKSITIVNCGIVLPSDKSLIYVKDVRPIMAFTMTDSDVKVSQTDETKNINIIQTTEAYTMTEVNFTNNVFWSPSDVKGFNLLLNRKLTASNITVSHNTLVNLYPAASYAFCQVLDITAGTISNNLFYLVNYTAAANDSYTGIIRELDNDCPEELYDTFLRNYAIYGDSVPTKRMKVGQNSQKGQIYNKKKADSTEIFDYEDGSANFNLVNGIFKPKNAAYGAQR